MKNNVALQKEFLTAISCESGIWGRERVKVYLHLRVKSDNTEKRDDGAEGKFRNCVCKEEGKTVVT